MNNSDQKWMQAALGCAQQALMQDEVPVGAVVVFNEEIIGRGWNQVITNNDPSAHAEIMALRDAGRNIGNYRLIDTTLYVTLEPCMMCAGAMIHARLHRLVYATPDPKTGAIDSIMQLLDDNSHNHHIDHDHGVLMTPCAQLLRDFFKAKR